MDLTRLTASQAADLIKRGEITSEALVSACLARIDVREATIGAWAHIDREFALAQARLADAARRAGTPQGPLHGVPVGIKDVIDTADLPTENGTPIFKGRRPVADASVVVQLKSAGAVILGKTVTTELAFFGPGRTRNPANPEHTPGGSSSGSAAAVADFHVPLALGTQTAGSILRPASYCGCIGWKPTFGAISRAGVLPQSPPQDTIGGFARSIDDIALLTDCVTRPDANDPDMATATPPSLVEALHRTASRPLRLAFVPSPAWPQGEAAMQNAFLKLVADLGPSVIAEVGPSRGFADGVEAQRTVQFRDIAENYGPLADAHPDIVSAKLVEVIGLGRKVSPMRYTGALALREPLYEELLSILDAFDAILTPAAPGPAPRGLEHTGSPVFNGLWTYLRVPALSLPLLTADGLPLGVQFVGRRHDDGRLLNTAQKLIERARAWHAAPCSMRTK